ncbi:MAG TPA: multiheme c-type cytochrome, partial [Planctomycetaceae bacterium]|nr:multiheme c-type cytochrome [Planctomycetaceae bacterium]
GVWYWGTTRAPAPTRSQLGATFSESSAYAPPTTDGYIGSAECARCHRDVADEFQTHPMSRSLTRVATATHPTGLSPEETRVAGKQRFYEIECGAGAMIHHERMLDATGEPIFDQAVPMDFVVGSGRRALAYLYQREDLLFMSPLNWYTQTQKWDLAPSYLPDDPLRFDRRVIDQCVACHAGRVAPVGRALNRYQSPPFLELAIGCENCHGPGRAHVAHHESGDLVGDDSIVNPARLEPALRESVCYQCHLQAAVRLLRPGRSDFDFRPGQNLDDIWTVLDTTGRVGADGRTRSVNHVQQMRESRCYQESAGRFGCTSCHDPHRVPEESEKPAFYRRKCLNCHDEQSCRSPAETRATRADSCIACHLPTRTTEHISHVTQTDHRVLRFPDIPVHESKSRPGDELLIFDRAGERLDRWERDRALGLGAWMYLSRSHRDWPPQLAQVLRGVLAQAPDDGVVLDALGAMASEHRLTAVARDYYERAREIPSAREDALLGLLDIYYLDREWNRALECADESLAIDLGSAKVHALRADILAQLGRDEEALASARRALEFNPTLVPVREWLVKACRRLDREEEAREQETIIERMQTSRLPPIAPAVGDRAAP